MSTEIAAQQLANGRTFRLIHGDLTEQNVCAIVNAANAQLQHDGGLAAASATKRGESIQRESTYWVRQHGPIDHNRPAVTDAGDLPAQRIIHAVGPRWGEGDEDPKLQQAVISALRQAHDPGLTSLALSPISTGIFGFPKDRAAHVICSAVDQFDSERPDSPLKDIRLTIIDEATLEPFREEFTSRLAGGR